ncbi:MAG: hypothetical protein LKM36_04210 [Flavobacteriales bacterium]|jgi:hypothetical protein|nr:hypothetical protein [Flavobacteriales bacterium]MCI1752084.1 hypothetical protein [Flavobacteriales bacterium]
MRIALLLSSFMLVAAAVGQNQVFWKAEDYPDSGMTVLGDINVEPHMGRFVITYEVGGDKKTTACRKIWGFQFDHMLYRIAPEGKVPVRLMAQGAVFYWENGFAHLRMQRDSVEAAAYDFGRFSYMSKDRMSEIVPACFEGKGMTKAAKQFKDSYSAYADMLGCIGAGTDMDSTRQCVVNYEVAVEEGKAAKP